MRTLSLETINNKYLLKYNKIILTFEKTHAIFMTIGQEGMGFLADFSAIISGMLKRMAYKEEYR